MAEFNVQTTNPFAFLDDDAPAPSKKAAPKKEEKPKPAPRAENSRKGNDNKRSERGDRSNGDRPRGRGRGGAEGGRGRGRGRGGGRPREGGDNRPKREFDRQSGTGRNDRNKRDGKGKYNWGEEGEQPKKAEATEGDAEKTEDAAEPTVEIEVPAQPEEPVEPEPVVFTLEEVQAKAAALRVEGDIKIARAVNNDDSAFQGTAEISKSDEIDFQLEIGGGVKAPKNKGGKKKKSNISFDEFLSQGGGRNRGGNRGGERGGRGGRGRGNGRGYKAPAINDQHFPKLG